MVRTECRYVQETIYVDSDQCGARRRREGGEEEGDSEEKVSASVCRACGEAEDAC